MIEINNNIEYLYLLQTFDSDQTKAANGEIKKEGKSEKT